MHRFGIPPAQARPAVRRAHERTQHNREDLSDPSLRNDPGKGMLRLLHVNAIGAEQLSAAAMAVPPHCVGTIVQPARQYAKMWQEFAHELDGRARIIDPSAARR